MRASWYLAALLVLGTAPSQVFSAAAPPSAKLPRYGIFIYSSICTEAGNTAGNHVVLIRDGDRDILYWYWSEGAMKGPAEAKPLAIDDKTGAIKFSVDTAAPLDDSAKAAPAKPAPALAEKPSLANYQGSITEDAITLVQDTAQAITIPRVKDFSKKAGPCGNPGK
jgi:hypothetical protein